MDTKTAFWEIIREIGSSPEEFKKLFINVNFLGEGICNLVCSRVDQHGSALIEENRKAPNNWSFTALHFHEKINLHDPESFDKIEDFVNRVRGNRNPDITKFNFDVRIAQDNVEQAKEEVKELIQDIVEDQDAKL